MKIVIKESQYKRIVEQRGGSNKRTTEEFIDIAQKVHADDKGQPLYDYSLTEYKDSNTKVKIICPKHKEQQLRDTGNEYFEISPNKHIHDKQGCRYCYIESKKKYSDSDLENEAKKYQTAAEFKKSSFLHFNAAQKRGKDFYKKITSHFIPETESAGEKLITKILVDNNFIDSSCLDGKCPERQKTFEGCINKKEGKYCRKLKFDFFIPSLNTVIEYDGEQHFRPSEKFGGEKFETTKENDSIKNDFCTQNNINLIRIHYKVPSNKIETELLNAIDNPKPISFIGDYDTTVTNLNENFKPKNTYPAFIRQQLELIYRPLGLWGHAPNPNDDCETNLGVLDIFPHSENDSWSVLNRFDTNSKVERKMREIFNQTNPEDTSQKGFENWIVDNRNDLFGPDGSYTQELVDLNMDTIISGNRREEYAVKILNDKFPNTSIKRYCSGDIRDTKKGIDITVEHPTKPFNVQVKPFMSVNSFFEPDGDTFFEVKSYLEVNKYSETNVQVFMFVNSDLNEFILFKNKKTKIGQMTNNIIRFYEPPLYTNMTFVTKQKRKKNKFEDTEKIFGLDTSLEKNLEFRSQTIQKLLQDLKNQKK